MKQQQYHIRDRYTSDLLISVRRKPTRMGAFALVCKKFPIYKTVDCKYIEIFAHKDDPYICYGSEAYLNRGASPRKGA